jgi:hypothetical protein
MYLQFSKFHIFLKGGNIVEEYLATGLDKPLGFKGVEAPRISGLSAHEGSKVAIPTQKTHLRPGNIRGTHFCYRLSRHRAIVQLEGLCE